MPGQVGGARPDPAFRLLAAIWIVGLAVEVLQC